MRTLRYWVAECLNDSRCYSVRGRTKAEVTAELCRIGLRVIETDLHGKCWGEVNPADDSTGRSRFALPKKVEIPYTDTFDLVCRCLGEGGVE